MDDFKLNKATCEFEKLRSSYGNFRNPCIKININGKEMTPQAGMKVSMAEAETSTYKSGCFKIKITDAYDIGKKFFKWDTELLPGSEIKISMGYSEKYKTVFAGIISSVNYNFTSQEGPAINVGGFDKSILMMKGRKSAIWENKKHIDIAKDISDKYKLRVSGSDTEIKYETVVQNHQTDFEFISYMASLNSFEFFVLGDNVYFRKFNEDNDSALTITMYDNILYADIGVDIADQIGGVCARGYSLKKEETESIKKSVKSLNSGGKTGVEILNKISPDNFIHYIYEPDVDKQKADKVATSYLEKTAMEYVNGEIRTMGIPEITAGRYITLDGIWGAGKTKLVYVKSARHVMDDDGYITYYELGGNSL